MIYEPLDDSRSSFRPQESSLNVEAVEQTYWRNPILRYTQHPLHSPLLPLPYGDVSVHRKCRSLVFNPPLNTSIEFHEPGAALAQEVERGLTGNRKVASSIPASS
jgi:hypothetical protein